MRGASPTTWLEGARRLYRYLTPLRLLVVVLVFLGAVGAAILGVAAVLPQLLLFPAVAAGTDAAIAVVRIRARRFPWSGLATGLFVAILVPPQGGIGPLAGSPLLLVGATVAALAILAKHVLRSGGRPWFNPAALGMVAAAALFGLTPAWWAVVSLPALLGAGLIVNARQWQRWAQPVSFFGTYAAIEILHLGLVNHVLGAGVLFLAVADPSVLFFTLFMVSEPRSAPADPALGPVHGAIAGLVAGALGVVAATSGSLLTSESLFLGLLVANLVAVVIRAVAAPVPAARPSGTSRTSPRRRPAPTFGVAPRMLVAFVALILILVATHAVPPPPAPSSTPPKVLVVSCTQDNRTISASTLSMLHQRLGPSVILFYDPASGATEFFDPVNKVTVYETDLFEDYGSAEFNGDDSIVSTGCALGSG